MELLTSGSAFIFNCTYEERTVAKDAGFEWHGGPCRPKCLACPHGVPARRWWTDDKIRAARLMQYADDATASALGEVKKSQDASRAADADVDIPVPEGCELLPFQRAGVAYAMGRDNVLFGDEMGCIDGEAVLRMTRAGRSFRMSLADAYVRFHSRGIGRYAWDPTIVTRCRALADGELRQIIVRDIVKKGLKKVVRVTLASGKSIRVTPDHEFAQPDDKWTRADALAVGDAVLTNGTRSNTKAANASGRRVAGGCPLCGATTDLVTYRYAKFRGYCRTCMYRTLRLKPNWRGGRSLDKDGYVMVSGQQNHPRANNSGQVYEHVLVMEHHLGRFLSWPEEQIHHRDENPANNALSNLELVTPSEHHRAHHKHLHLHGGGTINGGVVCFIPTVDTVVSVTPAGVIDVYDIVMSDPYRNFVANGIVVANCGKTVQALATINANATAHHTLVVCPATLRINWRHEAETWLTRPTTIDVIEGREMPSQPSSGDWLVVVNYDRLIGVAGKPLLDTIRATRWDTVICDECTALKNPKAQRTQAVLGTPKRKAAPATPGIIHSARRRLMLTGTPILNRPIEIQPVVGALLPDEFGNFFKFALRYANGHQGRFGWDFSGSSHLDELQDRLRATCMIRRLKKDILDLPPKRRQVIELPQNGSARAVDDERRAWDRHADVIEAAEAEVDLAKASDDSARYEAAVEALRKCTSIAFAEISKARHDLAVSKIPAVCDHIMESLECEQKLVVFVHHHDVAHAIIARLAEQDIKTVVLTGETPLSERQVAVDEFQSGDARVFLGSIGAAGMGITLTASSVVLFAELDWTPARVTQAEDRCWRIGTTKNVLIQHLVVDGSLDAKMAKTLVAKQKVADEALDNVRSAILAVPAVPKSKRRTGDDDKPIAPPTSELEAAAHEALRIIATMDWDHARERNEVGFSRYDNIAGHELAARATWTPKQAIFATRLARKYRRQLPEHLAVLFGGTK